jgi:predicted solute-binding protein
MIELIGAYPAKLAQMLADDEIDVGLIPVASIPQLDFLSNCWKLLHRDRR